SPLVDGMLGRASQLGFRPERLRLYQRLQTYLGEEVPYLPLYVRLQWLVARPEVRDLGLQPSGLHRLQRASGEPPTPGGPPPRPRRRWGRRRTRRPAGRPLRSGRRPRLRRPRPRRRQHLDGPRPDATPSRPATV